MPFVNAKCTNCGGKFSLLGKCKDCGKKIIK